MFSFGTITFYQLNILFVIAVVTAVIFLLTTVLLVLRVRRLKREYNDVHNKLDWQVEAVQAPNVLDESVIEDVTQRVLRKVLTILKGNEQS